MMNNKLVSIITPCYNGGRFIAETINSVLAQTYKEWEMIIVDDGSSDDSAKIVKSFADKDERISLVSQENAGSAAARNNGIRRAKGRFIALLDADDLWDPDFLRQQLRFMKRKNTICVFSSYRRINEEGQEILRRTIAKREIGIKEMKVRNQIGCLTGLYDSGKYGKVYLKEDLKSIRDDYAYWYDIVALEDRACGNPKVLASYRVLSGSTTGDKKKLIKKQYSFYRSYLKENPIQAAFNTVRWGLVGLSKFH